MACLGFSLTHLFFWDTSRRKFNPNDKRNKGGKAPPLPQMSPGAGMPPFGSGPGGGSPGSSSTSSVVSRPVQQGMARPLFICRPYVNSHLLKGNFKTIVVLPKHVDPAEWIALNGKLKALLCNVEPDANDWVDWYSLRVLRILEAVFRSHCRVLPQLPKHVSWPRVSQLFLYSRLSITIPSKLA